MAVSRFVQVLLHPLGMQEDATESIAAVLERVKPEYLVRNLSSACTSAYSTCLLLKSAHSCDIASPSRSVWARSGARTSWRPGRMRQTS